MMLLRSRSCEPQSLPQPCRCEMALRAQPVAHLIPSGCELGVVAGALCRYLGGKTSVMDLQQHSNVEVRVYNMKWVSPWWTGCRLALHGVQLLRQHIADTEHRML